MLDELPDIVGQDLPVVGLPLRPTQIEVMFLGSFDYGGNRDLLPIFIPEEVPDIGVVISLQLDLRVFDHVFFYPQLAKDIPFDLRANFSSRPLSLIDDGKLRRVLSKVFEKCEEPASTDLQDLEHMLELDFSVNIAPEKHSDLLVAKGLV